MRHFAFLLFAMVLCATLWCGAATPVQYTCDETLIYPIRECDNAFSRQLFPQDKASQELMDASYPAQSVPGSTNAFLIFHKKKWILIDTGITSKESTVLATLEQLHVAPMQVEIIIITHNHSDHTGNLLDSFGRARFPKAVVYLPAEEVKAAKLRSSTPDPHIKSITEGYMKRNRAYKDGQEIVPGLKAIAAPGHTLGHMMLLLNESALFIGDLVHAVLWQFPNPELCTAYDADPAKASESRIKFLEQAAENDWVILGAHIPYPGIGTVNKVKDAKKPAFQFITLKETKI